MRGKRFLIPKHLIYAGLIAATLPLASCAGGPFGNSLEQSLSADPRLQNQASPSPEVSPTASPSPNSALRLPANFPGEIPLYPGAALLQVESPAGAVEAPTSGSTTRWTTGDPQERVIQFYQEAFQTGGWTIAPGAAPNTPQPAGQAIVAEQNGLRVSVAFPNATPTANAPTEFVLSYQQANGAQAGSPTPGAIATSPSPTDINAPIGPTSFSDVAQAPAELQTYITDLAKLGVLSPKSGAPTDQFKPNDIITRREYARWLVAANNRMFGDRPAQKIRLGVSSDEPAFKDVPRNDPDFATIQGLAEAGLIPSPLSGDTTAVNFRPDAPLARETLILWKAPIDFRQTLPNATVQAIQQSWGFQDAARIDPKAQRAVLADYQNGDLANIRRAFGFTTLFQPKKAVTRAEAASTLWFFGSQADGTSAPDALTNEPQPSP